MQQTRKSLANYYNQKIVQWNGIRKTQFSQQISEKFYQI